MLENTADKPLAITDGTQVCFLFLTIGRCYVVWANSTVSFDMCHASLPDTMQIHHC